MPGAYIAFTNFNYKSGILGSEFVGVDNFKFLVQSGSLQETQFVKFFIYD